MMTMMNRYHEGDKYSRHTGYNEVAELNNIIMVYPQAEANSAIGDPIGCWDYWGYTGHFYGQ